MTNLIVTDAQQLEVSSPILDLYELQIGIGTNNTLFFHSAKDLDNGTVSNDLIFDGNTYVSLPIIMDDIEKQSSGAMNRPKLTIANVESMIKAGSDFKTEMDKDSWNGTVDGVLVDSDTFKFEDLIGQRVTRRRTLEKYTGLNTVPYEFDSETFIIDRIAAKTAILCELELASPADITGIRVPNRQVIGKYCPWIYQGFSEGVVKSACSWQKSQQIGGNTTNNTGLNNYSFYFTKDDEPLVLASYLTGSATDAWKGVYAANISYTKGQYVSYQTPYTATVSGNVSNSVNVNIDASATNSSIKKGFVVTSEDATINGTVTVEQIAGTYVKLSSAQTIGDDDVLIFTAPVAYFRAEEDHTGGAGIAPAPRIPQWTLVRTYTIWNNRTTYSLDDTDPDKNPYVHYQDTIWRAIVKNTNKAPDPASGYWVRGDVCGKTLKSCKVRFQAKHQMLGTTTFVPTDNTEYVSAHGIPSAETDTNIALPFGGFPGSRKFR